ncbi:hypothetical protein Tco_1336353, partial [Tanacetum coccineum]
TTEGERGGGAVSIKEGKSREVVDAGSWAQKAAENEDQLNKMSRRGAQWIISKSV